MLQIDHNLHTGPFKPLMNALALVLGIVVPAAKLTTIWPHSSMASGPNTVCSSVSLCVVSLHLLMLLLVLTRYPRARWWKASTQHEAPATIRSQGPTSFPQPLAALGLFHAHTAGLWIISLSWFHQTKTSPQCLDTIHLVIFFFFFLTSPCKDQVRTEPLIWGTGAP